MRKTSILFLIIGTFIGFFFGVKAVEDALSEMKSEDEDDPEPAVLKTQACKPWCRLV